MSDSYVIVGGGLAGLLVAKALKSQGIDFIGLEATDSLGGRLQIGHHRLYNTECKKFLEDQLGLTGFEFIEESPGVRKKGKWSDVGEEHEDYEKLFLGAPFYSPSVPNSDLLKSIVEELAPNFKTNHRVFRVSQEEKKVFCEGGHEIPFEKLIWCADLGFFEKVGEGQKQELELLFKKKRHCKGGLNLELEVSENPLPSKNTTVYQFRYKDKQLKAFGNCISFRQDGKENHVLNWTVFLEDKLLDDREEVAKIVRTLKREILKEFPGMGEKICSEKIVYLPRIFDGRPQPNKKLEILPDVTYLGTEIFPENSTEELWHLDRVVENCQIFSQNLERLQASGSSD